MERINTVKMSTLSKAIYIFYCKPYQNINGIFHRTRTNILKIYLEPEKTPNIQSYLEEKRNKVAGITLHDIKLYYKAIVIKTAWYWHKNRHKNQWNRIESPEINPCLYG